MEADRKELDESRCRQNSAVRCGRAPRVDQIVDTNRSRRGAGVHVYSPRLFENRSTSSNVRKAGALVPPPSCLGEVSHGWVPVYTHSTPVLTSVRRLWVTSPINTGRRATLTTSEYNLLGQFESCSEEGIDVRPNKI